MNARNRAYYAVLFAAQFSIFCRFTFAFGRKNGSDLCKNFYPLQVNLGAKNGKPVVDENFLTKVEKNEFDSFYRKTVGVVVTNNSFSHGQMRDHEEVRYFSENILLEPIVNKQYANSKYGGQSFLKFMPVWVFHFGTLHFVAELTDLDHFQLLNKAKAKNNFVHGILI